VFFPKKGLQYTKKADFEVTPIASDGIFYGKSLIRDPTGAKRDKTARKPRAWKGDQVRVDVSDEAGGHFANT
jgi:hypothetical protein